MLFTHGPPLGAAVSHSEHHSSTLTRSNSVVCFFRCVCAEGLTHCLPGAGAGQSEGGAGDQEQPAAPEREEAHGDGQTGGDQSLLGNM